MRRTSPRPFVHLTTLLASLALVTASAPAQETTAHLVRDANRTSGSDFNSGIYWVMPIGNSVVFPRDTLALGSELWISDGTAKGTRILKDLTPGPATTIPENPVAFGPGDIPSHIAFRDNLQRNVWVTDGTEAGTVKIFTSQTLEYNGNLHVAAGMASGFFFNDTNWDNDDASELFFSDGTAAGTRSLNPMNEGSRQFREPYGYTIIGPWCYFIANAQEIWRSDGTLSGTTRQMTINDGALSRLSFLGDQLFIEVNLTHLSSQLWTAPLGSDQPTRIQLPEGSGSAAIPEMIAFGGELFFTRLKSSDQRELWSTDGTSAGTRRILLHGGEDTEPRSLGNLKLWKDALYLGAYLEDETSQLWRIDSPSAAPRRIASFALPKTLLEFYETQQTADFLYFQTSDNDGYHQLWRTQGDAASTRLVKGTPHIAPPFSWPLLATTSSGSLFFVGDRMKPEEALWRLRGKTHGAIRLTKPEKTTGSGTADSPAKAQSYEIFEGKLLSFVDTGKGKELWRMNPDGRGARSAWKPPVPMTSIYSTLGFHAVTAHGAIFSLYDGAEVRQIWVTDGTRRGTRRLSDHSGDLGGYPDDFVKLGDTWYYSVVNNDIAAGASLWKTDGTPAGTTKIVAVDGTAPGPLADQLVIFNDLLYFFSADSSWKIGLWRSDGTPAGTVMIRDEWFGESHEIASSLAVAGGELVFAVRETERDTLWHSDGTAAGTMRADYSWTPYGDFFSWGIGRIVDLNGTAIFQGARAWLSRNHWWRYDATGVTPLREDIVEDQMYPWHPGNRMHAVAGNRMFYHGYQDSDGELWITDGTNAGTHRVKDIHPGYESSYPSEMLAVGDVVYFIAYEKTNGTELWRSDGTEAGTVLVADIEPGPNGSNPRGLKVMDGKLYFSAQRRDIGRELFSIDLPE